MRRIYYGSMMLFMVCTLFTGCASFKAVDLNPKIQSGQLVQKTDNIIVLFDKSASMGELQGKPMVNESTRLIHGKNTTKNMVATIPDIKLTAALRTFWSDETELLYGMKAFDKKEYTKAINSIEFVNRRTPMDKAITDAGKDLNFAKGHSAIIIVSDFSETPNIDDIRPVATMAAMTKVNAEYGDKLCVYAIQIGYTLDGKELSEQIVQNVKGGYTVNADKLVTPAAMAAFVERIISGNCDRYPQLVAKPKEKVVIVAADPMAEEKVAAAVSETKAKEKVAAATSETKSEENAVAAASETKADKTVIAAASETNADGKIIILAFEDVHFDFAKSTLTPEAQTILKRDVQILKDNPKAKVRIAGYTSASGTMAYNQTLSENRARAVQEYLINEGIITPDRLSTIGYGETNPLCMKLRLKKFTPMQQRQT